MTIGYPEKLAGDPRSVSELFLAALTAEEDAAWDAIGALHYRGSREVLDRAIGMCGSPDSAERARGADVLGQLGIPVRTFPEECFASLLPLLADADDRVIFSAIFALQHLDRDRAMPHVLPFRHYRNDEIRYAVACALGAVARDEAIAALVELTADRDSDVRDWATFGLGSQSEADSETIRSALAARLDDADEGVRYEAVCGLGRRGDPRAILFLKTMLHEQPDDTFAREAAAMLVGLESDEGRTTVELLGALQRRQRWTGAS